MKPPLRKKSTVQKTSALGISTLEPTKKVFQKANTAQKEFLAAGDTKKRMIVSELLWNLSLEGREVASIQYKTPFDVIAKAPKKGDLNTMLALWNAVGTFFAKSFPV